MKNYNNCPICNSSEFNQFIDCKDYTASKETFTIVKCKSCDFAFTNPIPDESKIGQYYESEEYISHSNTSKGIINTLYQMVRNYTIKNKVKLLRKYGSGNTLLDIGSGTGDFLNACKKSGLEVKGIEPSEIGRKQTLENFDIEVFDESKIETLPEGKFDYISMWHVLEHVYHLNKRIEEISRILNENGTLIVAVPNLKSLDANKYKEHWAAYDVPRHLYHFSPKNINNLMQKHGFQVVKILPMPFDSFYVSMLSEKYLNGKNNLIKAIYNGLLSNLKAGKDKWSSQIYIIKKATI